MSTETEYLKLLKKDPIADKNDTFNLKTMLNDNWDKLDAFAAQTPLFKLYSYTGTGENGSLSPNVIDNIGFVPDAVIVTKSATDYGYALTMIRPCVKIFSSFTNSSLVTWGENSVEWYVTSADGSGEAIARQCNTNGTTYYCLILGHKEAGA